MPMPWWRSACRGSRSRVTSPAARAAGQNRLPGRDEPDPGVGGVHARVQPAHQEPHPGADEVGQGRRPAGPDREGGVASPAASLTSSSSDEAGAVQDVAQARLGPHREPPTGEVVVREDRRPRRRRRTPSARPVRRAQRAVEVGEGHRDRSRAEVHVGVAGPAGGERRPPERERIEVGLHRQASSGATSPGPAHHRPGGVERHDRRRPARRCTSPARTRGRWPCPAGAGRPRASACGAEPRPSPGLVARALALVDGDGGSVHGSEPASDAVLGGRRTSAAPGDTSATGPGCSTRRWRPGPRPPSCPGWSGASPTGCSSGPAPGLRCSRSV